MAKGTYRMKRLQVLEDLQAHDPQWAEQIRDLRATNPQAYRKQLIRAEVALAAATGRKLTLSMRPKRFGGDEDPVLVRRVLELRKAYPELTRGVNMAAVFGRPSPENEAGDLGSVEGWKQDRTPDTEQSDLGSVEGWKQDRTPDTEQSDLGSVEGWKQDRTPDTEQSDLGSVEGWKQNRTPQGQTGSVSPAQGQHPRGRAPEMAERPPEDPSAPKPRTRRALDRPSMLGQREGTATGPQPDLSVLDGSISDFKEALSTGVHDAWLDALEAAEKAGKGRKGVLKAIKARR